MACSGRCALGLAAAVLLCGGCSGALRWNDAGSGAAVHGAQPQPTSQRSGALEYRVRQGDTLYSIAFRHQLDYHELARWNGIGSDYRILPGQVLRLRAPAGETRRTVVPRTVPAERPSAAADASRQPTVVAGATATVSGPAAVEAVPVANRLQWTWPLNGPVARNYAPSGGNKGLDFTGTVGMPVLAAASGRVVYSGNALKGYGELIIIKHDETYLSAYADNRRRLVKEGDVVTAGQPIAELGLGPENKPQLHFEIRERGQPVNPLDYLPKQNGPPP